MKPDKLRDENDALRAQLRACKRENRILRRIAQHGCGYKSSSGNCFNRRVKVYCYLPCHMPYCPLLKKGGGK